jgi:hypothetical protein
MTRLLQAELIPDLAASFGVGFGKIEVMSKVEISQM